jgi:hypothetical protein
VTSTDIRAIERSVFVNVVNGVRNVPATWSVN